MPQRRLLLGLFCVSSIASAQGAPPHASLHAPRGSEIPFLFEDERIYVPVRIGAAMKRWFILDTGASGTIIDAAVARAEHLQVAAGEAVEGAGSGSSEQSQASSVELEIGNVGMRVARPAVLDLVHLLGPTSGRAPAGIIGSQFFREHFVDIDFKRRRIAVAPPGAAPRAHFERSVPLTFIEQTPLAHVVLTLRNGRRVEANALVDLGAKSTFLIPEPFIEREDLRESVGKTVVTGFGAGVGGDTFYAFARASRLSFAAAGALGLDDPVIGLSVGGTLRSTWNEGLLGAEFLSSFRVGFDYRHARLFLARAGAVPRQFDRSGLFLVAAGDSLRKLLVRQVVKGSPGDEAGLLPGDEILTIDGNKAKDLGLEGARQRLKQSGDGIVTVGYRRGTDQLTARIALRDLI